MEPLKQLKIRSFLTAALYIVLGLVLVIFPDNVARLVSYVFSVMLLITGIILIALYFINGSSGLAQKRNFTMGLILSAASVYCLINVGFLVKIIPVVLGFTVLINGISKFVHVFDLIRTKSRSFIAVLVMAGLLTAFGVLLLINPFGAASLFYIMIGTGLIIGGITDIVTVFLVAKKLQDFVQEKNAVDITDISSK